MLALFSITPGPLDANTGDANNATWSFDTAPDAFDFLRAGETLTLTYTVRAQDDSGVSANDTAEHDVTIAIEGTNDAAGFSGADTGSVFEDGTLVASGDLDVTDADHDESAFASTSALAGTYGDFTFDLGTGGWTYTLRNGDANVQALNTGDAPTDTLTVYSTDGSSRDIVVTVNGINEPVAGPVLASLPATCNDANDPNNNTVADNDNDTADGSGVPNAIIGTDSDNSINGGNSTADIIYGRGGNDTINGLNQGDTIYGQAGGDTLNGGAGDDTIYGGSGNDTINGSTQNDTIYGGSGDDTIHGNENNDHIYGGSGNDLLYGDNNDDVIHGDSGTDTIDGGDGKDTLYGGTDNDTIAGGDGADLIYGGSGNDTISGGGGSDVIVGGFGVDNIDVGASDRASDTVKFFDLCDTNDTVSSFVSGEDKFDLSALNSGNGTDGVFGWGGEQTGAYVIGHGVTWYQDGGNVVVLADTDGDLSAAEFMFTVTGVSSLQQDDFIL